MRRSQSAISGRPATSCTVASAADEATCITRLRAGDPEAFGQIFQIYARRLVTYAYGQLGTVAQAEEVVQDVFLRVWQRRAEWEPGASIAAYLYAAVRNGVINLQRRRGYEAVSGDLPFEGGVNQSSLAGVADSRPSIDDAMYSRDRAEALQHAVAALPPRAREAVVLHWQHRLTYAEAAVVMGTSVRTVENHLATALKTLRLRLADWR